MSLADNRRLFNIATRRQLYIERVKVQFARQFNTSLGELKIELQKLLQRINYKTLDALTKAELQKLLIALREVQGRIYSQYTEQLIKQLRDFMVADLEVTRRIYATAHYNIDLLEDYSAPLEDDTAIAYIKDQNEKTSFHPLFGLPAVTGDDDKMWNAITLQPMPANGVYLLPFVKGFSQSAQRSIENIINRAWANGATVDETSAEIFGLPDVKQGRNGQLQNIAIQAGAATATVIQHVSSVIAAGVSSAVFGVYQWVSILDGRTTEVCSGRANKVFRFGSGPLPPAHIKCRSHIAAIVGTDPIESPGLQEWAADQSVDFLDDFTEDSNDEDIPDLTAYAATHPMSLQEYRASVFHILSR